MGKLLDKIFLGTPDRKWFWSTTFPFFLIASLFKRRTTYVCGGVYDGLTSEDFERMLESAAAKALREDTDKWMNRFEQAKYDEGFHDAYLFCHQNYDPKIKEVVESNKN